MRVKLAKTAGFCMGVRRAMNAVLEAAHKSDKNIHTLGPLVHNNQAMEMLKAKNVKVISGAEEAESGMLFIRAHGVTPEVRESLQRTGIEVCDMTCPHVRRAQKIIERHAREGSHTIIIGDPGHPEVVGLLGHAEGRGHVVSSAAEILELPDMARICVVAQTTQNARRFHALTPLIRERFPEAVIHNTVCSATDDRQAEVRALAQEVDAVIVVGGKHSGNTVRLAEIAREEGVPTFHIETAQELDPETIRRFNTVGVTAGASTPHWVFRAVVDKAEQYLQARSMFIRVPMALFTFGVYSYLYIGTGSAGMTYAALRLLDIKPRFSYLFISFMYVVSMHLINRFTDRAAAKLNDPHRMNLLERFQYVFIGTAVAFAAGALILALRMGPYPFVLMLLCLVAGIGYNLRLVPLWLARWTRFKAVKEIPGSKDIFVAFAWATVAVILPCLAEKVFAPLPTLCVFSFAFIMVFIRSLVFDMKDLEGDRIVGKETFPLIMGHRPTNRLVLLSTIALALIALVDATFPHSSVSGYLLLPVVAFVGLYLLLYYRRIISQGLMFEIIVDAPFILTGLLAFCIPYGLG